MQKQITSPVRLLDADGNVACPGYAKQPLFEYSRADIKAKKSRIKEWDYYFVSNKQFGLAITVSDLGYLGAMSLSVIDYVTPAQFTASSAFLFPLGKLHMPATSESGDVNCKNGKVEMHISNDGSVRRLTGTYPNADKFGTDVSFDITLTEFPEESMVIATPFAKKGHFYLNQKINCMRAEGVMKLGDKECAFDAADSLATLDWGRGVWTYDNTWYWSSLSTRLLDGRTFGWNLGYGFGNTEAASEDMLFADGKAHKLGRVHFEIPEENGKLQYMQPWRIADDEGRLDVAFEPIIDRYAPVDLKLLCMIPHQVFGKFSGTCVLDDGSAVNIKDEIGFAEVVRNKW